jgi:hypothetical protein
MDHGFYYCVDYKGVRSYTPQQKADMGRFLHPNIALNDGALARAMFEGVHEVKRTSKGGVRVLLYYCSSFLFLFVMFLSLSNPSDAACLHSLTRNAI